MADRATWAKRVGLWRASGQTAAEFSECRDFSVASLRYWSSQLGRERAEETPPTVRIARVVRALPELSEGCAVATGAGAIVVEIAGARVAVGAGFDRDALTSVLDVLESRGRRGAR